ncbi:uncharacterized protein LOC132277415 [Cornus florida]|uniref:uncharacterized protein LOC132277415 n=1 Tax=Cornus florida TaxID=4283 RepID=UPI00289AAF59|nr:uncharacterized protein LOC132277415 [Cornus florida]
MDPFCLPTLIDDDEEDEEEEMGVCLLFTYMVIEYMEHYMLPPRLCWEGSANDSRVLLETIFDSTTNFPLPPKGKYYLVDSGYTNMRYFLAPYCGERYHLQEYRGRRIRGPHELFNYRHSSLKNVIERCFGILKMRWPILKLMPPYKLSIQALIVIACCTLHNFIRDEARLDRLFDEYGDENVNL